MSNTLTANDIAALKIANGNPAVYKDAGTPDSDIGPDQFNEQWWIKESLIEAAPKQWFSQLTSPINPPKHMGKKIVRYLYLPLLDDMNVNDQGIDARGATIVNGNLYGSSRDMNTIMDWQPNLTQTGGRVNRVFFTRQKIEATFEEFGFFYDYTEDELQFDTDMELKKHCYREAIRGAVKISEDRLQIDLINAAGTILYGGGVIARNQLSGDAGGVICTITYKSIVDLSLRMDDLNVPEDTQVIKGSTYSDTLTVNAARIMYVGTEPIQDLLHLTDYHGNQAFTEYKHYATKDNANLVNGEYGTIGSFRIVKVGKDMIKAKAQGAIEGINGANTGYHASLNDAGEMRYDVFFLLVVGKGSFETISFKNTYDGTNKFEIFTQDPKPAIRTKSDPFGKVGFTVITWYYGFALLREERIARIEVVAQR